MNRLGINEFNVEETFPEFILSVVGSASSPASVNTLSLLDRVVLSSVISGEGNCEGKATNVLGLNELDALGSVERNLSLLGAKLGLKVGGMLLGFMVVGCEEGRGVGWSDSEGVFVGSLVGCSVISIG
mmetsp:Transcript_34864/g.84238  ORF Transcript_34864/g.84238 Transcript_34864/m.84238 type:complete len:128 (-) Transcript_34864:694-1077(-)